MRILALLGLGLPVVAISGAVAYGSVAQISQSIQAQRAPSVVAQTIPARPSEAAQGFVLASTGTWDLASDPAQDGAEGQLGNLLGDDHAVPSQTKGALRSGDARQDAPGEGRSVEAPEMDVAVVTERPVAIPAQVVRPRVVVSADRRPAQELREQRVNQNRKREFRMPWQTGVFQ